jgi:putative ABC transport system permease protein
MKASKSFKLALNILRHSKLRSWLTIIGIVIGVAAVVAIISIGEGMQQSIEERLGGLGSDIITISPGFSRASGMFVRIRGGGISGFAMPGDEDDEEGLTDMDIMVIKSVENVEYVQGSISGRGEITYLAEEASVSIEGVEPLAWSQITTSELEQGRFLGPADYNAVVVGSRIANDMFKQPLALNRILTIEGKSFKIVGILEESGGGFVGPGGDSGVIMPLNAARDIFQEQDEDFERDEYDSITIKVTDDSIIEDTMDAIDAKLMLFRHVTERTKDYTITSSKSMQETVSETTETMTLFLGAIAAVSLLVGAVGIANTMFTTVLEKTKEIGIMKAIGARNRDIMVIFMMNSVLVGVVGGLIGAVLGTLVSSLMGLGEVTAAGGGMGGMGRIFGSTLVTPRLFSYALMIAIGISMLAGAIPAYRASKLKPVDALRYE